MGIEQGTVRSRCRLLLFESKLTAHSMFVGLWRWI